MIQSKKCVRRVLAKVAPKSIFSYLIRRLRLSPWEKERLLVGLEKMCASQDGKGSSVHAV